MDIAASPTVDFETFVKMLTTQLKNQDPLDPMDSANFASQFGPVPKLCRSFNRILCTKGEYRWETNQQQSLDRKLCALR